MRNEELFPFIKTRGVIEEGSNRIMLSQADSIEFVDILRKIVPQIGHGSGLVGKYKKWVRRCTPSKC